MRLASRYIIRSLRWRIGEAVSPDGAVEEGLGELATPLEVAGLVGRWVKGLVPWVHAVLAGCFLHDAKSALGQAQRAANLSEPRARPHEAIGLREAREGGLVASAVAPRAPCDRRNVTRVYPALR